MVLFFSRASFFFLFFFSHPDRLCCDVILFFFWFLPSHMGSWLSAFPWRLCRGVLVVVYLPLCLAETSPA